MLGAIIGDVVGSRFEFNNIKTKNFKLIGFDTRFTDDTVMTCAVARSLVTSKGKNIIQTLKAFGRAYPNAGYGGHFLCWVLGKSTLPYNSCGNGSAMRISSVGWVAKTEKEVKELSKRVTEVTHNHPEGLKGAEVVAMCIFKARNGATKEELKEYILSMYPEVADLDYEELRRTYKHGEEICQVTVPQALYCFLISTDFEDCLRTTISIGGDCDTTAAISCAVAEAYYKDIPEDIIKKVLSRFTKQDKINLLTSIKTIYEEAGKPKYISL